MEIKEWTGKFDSIRKNPPAEGTILRAYGGAQARLTIDLQEGKPPFIYARAYVPCIVGQEIDGWYLQHMDAETNHGWKCVLLSKAREDVLSRFGLSEPTVPVMALRVVRQSRSGQALLCEIAEFCPTETV